MRKLSQHFLPLSFLLVFAFSGHAQVSIEFAERRIELKRSSCDDTGEAIRFEASAVESIPQNENFLLVANDKCKNLLIVKADNGETVGRIKLDAGGNDPKWEGLARDEENNYYAIGAHISSADSNLMRFRLNIPDPQNPSTFSVAPDSVQRWNVSSKLKELAGPVKIEGLAVKTEILPNNRTKKITLIIGLREPKKPVHIVAADISAMSRRNNQVTSAQLYRPFSAGTISDVDLCLSSMTYVKTWKSFLITTSAESGDCPTSSITPALNGNILWIVPEASIFSKDPIAGAARKIWTFGVGVKAEGIVVFDQKDGEKTLRGGILYDNDRLGEGMYQPITLALWPDK